jgi:hypothetical protein
MPMYRVMFERTATYEVTVEAADKASAEVRAGEVADEAEMEFILADLYDLDVDDRSLASVEKIEPKKPKRKERAS